MAIKDVTEQFLEQKAYISFTDNNVTRYLSWSSGFQELDDGRKWAVWSPNNDTTVTIVKAGEVYYLKQGSLYLSWSAGFKALDGGRKWAVWSPEQDMPIRITYDDQTGLYSLTNSEPQFPLLSWSSGFKDLDSNRKWAVHSTTSDTPISIVLYSKKHVCFEISAPFGVGDLVAEVALEGGETNKVVLRGGRFEGTFPARAMRLTLLTTQSVPGVEAPLALENVNQSGTPKGTLVYVTQLFDGIDIPADGQLAVQLKWGASCHEKGSERFASFEHVQTAKFVGLDKDCKPLKCDDPNVSFNNLTGLPLGDNKEFNFGEIIALAGDFYAHFDKKASIDFASAWPTMGWIEGWLAGNYKEPTLVGDGREATERIVHIVHHATTELLLALELAWASLHPDLLARRFLALASVNHCHFGMQSWDGSINDNTNEALNLYGGYHQRAMDMVRPADAGQSSKEREKALLQALAVDAFGCHFLTDLFASGHIRVPRRLLADRFGIFRGALGMALKMHKEDNELGLWCHSRVKVDGGKRVVWRAYGDYQLGSSNAKMHLRQVSEAVRRSAEEIFDAFCGKQLFPAEQAKALLPVPLRAGTGPVDGDVLPDGTDPSREPNHYPLYTLNPDPKDGRIGMRRGGPNTRSYDVLEKGGGTFDLPGPS